MLLALFLAKLPWSESSVAKRWLLCPLFRMNEKDSVAAGKGQEESAPSVYTDPCRWLEKKKKRERKY